MTGNLTWLAIAALFFVGIHPGISGSPLRGMLVRVIGEVVFRAVFALLSIGGLAWMILAFEAAPYEPLWVVPQLVWIPVVLMPFSAILVVLGVTSANPTSAGQGGVLEREEPAKGVTRITRHPFLMGVVLWAAGHVAANGEVASVIFFGDFWCSVSSVRSVSMRSSARADPRLGKGWPR
ncbi:MAG: NnrU family protein [Rhodospirillaceae bacterium]|nr:NnrU family protein [Rhodospirillaceae bacterium]